MVPLLVVALSVCLAAAAVGVRALELAYSRRQARGLAWLSVAVMLASIAYSLTMLIHDPSFHTGNPQCGVSTVEAATTGSSHNDPLSLTACHGEAVHSIWLVLVFGVPGLISGLVAAGSLIVVLRRSPVAEVVSNTIYVE